MTDTVQLNEPPVRGVKPHAYKRRGFWRRFLFMVVLLLVVTVAAFFGWTGMTPASALKMLNMGAGYLKDQIQATPPFGGRTRVNILVLGADVSFDGYGTARTDTIKLVSVDLAKKSIAILSIPRDTWVDIPGHGSGRINSAYQFGGKQEINRISMASETITRFLGGIVGEPVTIDRYVRIQTGGFIKIIDALGGLDIEVEKQMDYDDPSQDLHIHLKPGLQHLDGYNTMCYVRFRHDADGDYGRIRRQDNMVRALAAKLSAPESKHNVRLLEPIMNMLVTDMSVNDLKAIKQLVDDVGMAGIHTAMLPTRSTTRGRASVVEVDDPDAAARAIRDIIDGPRPTVTVLNGTGKRGMARRVGDGIDDATYNVIGLGNTAAVEHSVVIAGARSQDAARALATQLGVAQVSTEQTVPAGDFGKNMPVPPPAEITVVIGKGYQAPAQPARIPTTE